MKKYICDCCGGQINRATMKCEYCGTAYREEYDNVIRLETYHNPVREYTAKVIVPEEMVDSIGPEKSSEYIIDRLAMELSKAIRENMVIVSRADPFRNTQEVAGYIKMIHPVQVSEMERRYL